MQMSKREKKSSSRIAILASGSGTNAENIIRHFNLGDGCSGAAASKIATVELVVSNKADAYVLTRAKNLNVPAVVMNKAQLCGTQENGYTPTEFIELLRQYRIDVVVLAGYLLQVPKAVIDIYRDRIINIHPALLPAYGGKGMYGERVHKAVLSDMQSYMEQHPNEPKDFYSGITIHLVDEQMDHGRILFQASFLLSPNETLESLEDKIHTQEQASYPIILAAWLRE